VRKLLHGCGYRFRLHKRSLPGSPDIVLVSRKKVIFVHGCFWHGHRCHLGRMPKSNIDFWAMKIQANAARDRKARSALNRLGWRSKIVWECQIRDVERLKNRLLSFLEDN
jgi:DNA mismatch endonuclease (patch repair protein)